MKKRNIKIPPFSDYILNFGRNPHPDSIETLPANVQLQSCNSAKGPTQNFLSKASILNITSETLPDASSQQAEQEYLKIKTLLVNAKSPKGKIRPPNMDKRSIKEKIVDLYLEFAEEKSVRKGPFIKCDFVKELVERENLDYLILSVFPDKSFSYNLKTPNSDLYLRDEDVRLCESINYQEIPTNIFDILLNVENLLHDYHIILEIRKHATMNHNDPAIFSFFTLLKPPSTLINWNIERYPGNSGKKDDFESIQKKYELEVMPKRAGSLYWNLTDPIALEFVCFLASYCHPFVSSFQGRSKKTLPEETKLIVSRDNQKIEVFSFEKASPVSVSCVEPNVDVFPLKFDRLKAELYTSLAKREITLKECDNKNEFSKNLVETFYFEVEMEERITSTKKNIVQVQVFTDRNGVFYTYSKDQSYIPCPYNGIPLNCVGSRQNLDKYLFQFAEIISKKFMQHMRIRHKNEATMKTKDIFKCESFFPEEMDECNLMKLIEESDNQECDNKKKRSIGIMVKIHLKLI